MVGLNMNMNCASAISCRIFGSTKTPFFKFAGERSKNFDTKYLRQLFKNLLIALLIPALCDELYNKTDSQNLI